MGMRPAAGGARPALSDEQSIAVARRNWLGGETIADLAAAYGVSDGAIQTALRRARDSLVDIVPREPFHRDRKLEIDVKAAFPHLTAAIVIAPNPDGRATANAPVDDDTLHAELGSATAREIAMATFPLLRGRKPSGVAFGSGRAVAATIEALKDYQNDPTSWFSLLEQVPGHSLAGNVFTPKEARAYRARGKQTNEADDHATGFAGIFPDFAGYTIGQAIAVASKEDREAKLARTWLGDQFSEIKPGLAITGVGVMDGGHRCFDIVENELDAINLENVRDLLEKLHHALSRLSMHFGGDSADYCPVGDICQRFFMIDPPGSLDAALKVAIKTDIEVLVDTLNEHLLTATKTQLAQIDTVLLIGAGQKKVRAIHKLLNMRLGSPHRPVVDALATDVTTATRILDLHKAANAAHLS